MVEWAQTANKNTPGQPTQFWINRTAPPVMHLWPLANTAGTLVYWGLRAIQDTGAYGNNMDVPTRFLPAMTTGLAYYLAMKTPGAEGRIAMIQSEYERQYNLAADEDRERAPFKLVPDLSR
jgi:hypothetical protein